MDDAVDYHSAVGDALMILIDGLTPFVQRVTSAALPPGVEWTELLRQKDAASGRRTGVYRSGDLSPMLRAMTASEGDCSGAQAEEWSRVLEVEAAHAIASTKETPGFRLGGYSIMGRSLRVRG